MIQFITFFCLPSSLNRNVTFMYSLFHLLESLKVWILWRTMPLYFMLVILWHARSLGSGAALLWAIFCFLLPVSIKVRRNLIRGRMNHVDIDVYQMAKANNHYGIEIGEIVTLVM